MTVWERNPVPPRIKTEGREPDEAPARAPAHAAAKTRGRTKRRTRRGVAPALLALQRDEDEDMIPEDKPVEEEDLGQESSERTLDGGWTEGDDIFWTEGRTGDGGYIKVRGRGDMILGRGGLSREALVLLVLNRREEMLNRTMDCYSRNVSTRFVSKHSTSLFPHSSLRASALST